MFSESPRLCSKRDAQGRRCTLRENHAKDCVFIRKASHPLADAGKAAEAAAGKLAQDDAAVARAREQSEEQPTHRKLQTVDDLLTDIFGEPEWDGA